SRSSNACAPRSRRHDATLAQMSGGREEPWHGLGPLPALSTSKLVRPPRGPHSARASAMATRTRRRRLGSPDALYYPHARDGKRMLRACPGGTGGGRIVEVGDQNGPRSTY